MSTQWHDRSSFLFLNITAVVFLVLVVIFLIVILLSKQKKTQKRGLIDGQTRLRKVWDRVGNSLGGLHKED